MNLKNKPTFLMHNIWIILIVFLWMLLGWKMNQDAKVCCQSKSEVLETDTLTSKTPSGEADAKAVFSCMDMPICFAPGQANPQYGSGFTNFVDSLIASIGNGQRLRIIGLYNSNEKNETGSENLGLYRSDTIRNVLADYFDIERMETGAQRIVGGGENLVTGKQVRFEVVEEEAAPIRTSTLIYFPFNSTQKMNDSEVEAYLDDVADRIKSSGERIRLTGHTDNIGSVEDNLELGGQRCEAVKSYLVSKGVSTSRILVDSKGKSQPVASNVTERGRAQNRRVELNIIQ